MTAVCKRKTQKKYLTRNSPPFSAMECKGQMKPGKDGDYVSKSDTNNVYKWVKVKVEKSGKASTIKKPLIDDKKPKHKYQIHDNGGRPFVVYDFGDHVDIYQQDYDETTEKDVVVKKLFGNLKYKKLFAGDNDLKDPNSLEKGVAKGNSVLLHTGPSNKYVYVGAGIREFTTNDGDEIVKYYSPVGNSDVPYPYAVGKTNTYFMLNNGTVKEGPKYHYVSNEDLDMTTDAYAQLYGFVDSKLMGTVAKTYKVKVLHKRN